METIYFYLISLIWRIIKVLMLNLLPIIPIMYCDWLDTENSVWS